MASSEAANPQLWQDCERPIGYYIANSSGELSGLQNLIEHICPKAIETAVADLGLGGIDIIFLSEPDGRGVIPELGIGAYATPNSLFVRFAPKGKEITEDNLLATLLHELHHCARFHQPGLGKSLGEQMVFEGLACLYEEERVGRTPIYASVSISGENRKKALDNLNDQAFDYDEWFFGAGRLERWLGYTLGYQLCKAYSEEAGKSAAEAAHTAAAEILDVSTRLLHET